MDIFDVFYFHARYGYEASDNEWAEKDEYGFIIAKDFNCAMNYIVSIYRDDLLSVEIKYASDAGIISCDNKEIAEGFLRSHIKTHYGEDE